MSLRASLLPSVLVVAAFVAFSSALRAPFVFDDHALFTDPAITSSNGWYLSFHPSQTRPLTWFTFWLNYAVAGGNAVAWHAVNLALHLAASWLVLDALSRVLPREPAVIAAFVFALHPVQTEPVTYIFARGTLLAAVLCLLSLRAWLRGRYWPAAAWFAFALLAKEECAAFPAFLVLLELARSRVAENAGGRVPGGKLAVAGASLGMSAHAMRAPIAVMFGLALAAVVRVAMVTALVPGSGAGAQAGIAPLDYLATQGPVILRYFQLLAVPVGFSVDPDVTPAAAWQGIASWLVLGVSALVAMRRFTGAREGFWYLAGVVLLLPTSSIFPAADLAADRRLYLPMLGFAALAGLLLRRTSFPVLLTAGAITYGMLSYTRADVWTSEEALWEDAMRQAPEKVRPRVQLARLREPAQARELLLEAKRMAPDDPDVAAELGKTYLAQGHPSLALGEFGRAVALAPDDARARNNRGVALMAVGIRDHAVTDFRKALELDPCLFDAHLNLRRLGLFSTPDGGCRFTDEQAHALEKVR